MAVTFAPKGEIYVNGAWVDITNDVLFDDGNGFTINRGSNGVGPTPDPTTCSFMLDNTSGNYSPDNPVGAYYGFIGRNTPFRTYVTQTATYAEVDGTAGGYPSTPHVSALNITGDIDIRMELDASFSANTTDVVLAQKYSATSTEQAWRVHLDADGFIHFNWWNSGGALAGVRLNQGGFAGRALRFTLDVDNGAGGNVVSAYYSDSINGTWNLAYQIIGGGTTSIRSTTSSPVSMGGDEVAFSETSIVGHYRKLQVYNGINGTLVANADFTIQTAGASSFVDSTGKTWTMNGTSFLSNRDIRMQGEISEWPAQWVGPWVYVSVTATGLQRRYTQGARPIQSALRRRIPSYAPLAYWPMEDGPNSSMAASAIVGGAPLKMSGFTFAAESSNPASAPLPQFQSNSGANTVTMYGTVPQPATTGAFSVYFLMHIASNPSGAATYMNISTSGTVATWKIQIGTGGVTTVVGTDSSGTQLFSQGIGTGLELINTWNLVWFNASQSGSDVAWNLNFFREDNTLTGLGFTQTSATVGRVNAISTPGNTFSSRLDGSSVGHIAVFPATSSSAFPQLSIGDPSPTNAYLAETPAARVLRIGRENAIPTRALGVAESRTVVPGNTTSTVTYPIEQQLGYQGFETAFNTLQTAALGDDGLLIDDRAIPVLTYRDKSYLYGQSPVQVEYSQLQLGLTPIKDDVYTVNSFTATRDDGGSSVFEKTSGTLSSAAPPTGVGLYAQSGTYSLSTDDQTVDRAAWEVAKGTVDASRYTGLQIELAKPGNANISAAVADLDVGGRLQVLDCPTGRTPPGTQDLLVRGYSEALTSVTRTLTYNCIPYAPFSGFVTDSATYGRADTDGSTLAASATSTASTISVATTSANSQTWTTDQLQFPFDILVSGEQMTVQTTGTVLNTNPSFESGTTGWTATNATLVQSSTIQFYGPNSGLLTTGAGAGPKAESDQQAAVAGNVYWATGVMYAPLTLPTAVGVSINWYNSSHVLLSTSNGNASIPAGTFVQFRTSFTAPASTAFASVFFAVTGTPGAGFQLYGDQVMLINYGAGAATSPQTFTVTRSQNGIVKAQSSGSVVSLNTPAYVGL